MYEAKKKEEKGKTNVFHDGSQKSIKEAIAGVQPVPVVRKKIVVFLARERPSNSSQKQKQKAGKRARKSKNKKLHD